VPAVPFDVVTLITVGTLLGLLKVTTKVAVVPSVTVGLLMLTTGNGVLSIIVPVPLAVELLVLVDVIVPFNTNVSVPSIMLSIVAGTFTVTLVAPDGMVTVVVVVV
jgi:hypothetical protein